MATLAIDAGELAARCAAIELLLLDVDGVLTDGRIILDDQLVESKQFYVRDGSAVELWRRAGKRAAIISGRSSRAVNRRAKELGMAPVVQGVSDKKAAFLDMIKPMQLGPHGVCYMGDDLPDLPLLAEVGLSACPADAAADVARAVHVVTDAPGGQGAVRELIELILRQLGKWDDLVAA
jgi:3-deoxy-D-manno-octulosonate 8-phosphate phosphatase (KDO 8-P phosphatase)